MTASNKWAPLQVRPLAKALARKLLATKTALEKATGSPDIA
jgi:hypothetical protein